MRKMIYLFFLALAMMHASAEEPAMIDNSTIGDITCVDWAESRKQRDLSQMRVVAWYFGYLSGYLAGKGPEILAGVDGMSITTWMDKYCDRNPLDMVSKGGSEFAGALGERQR